MASIVKRPNGSREIRVVLDAGRRPVIRLGRCDQKTAASVLAHVERLAANVLASTTPPPETLSWLSNLPDILHDRLARAGLCQARRQSAPIVDLAVEPMFDKYIERRTDWESGTRLVFLQAKKHLTAFFGSGRQLNSVTVGEAKDFRRHMAAKYSEAYVGKMIRQARQLWRDAIERELIADNPWKKIPCGSSRNPERQRYITAAVIHKVIDTAADPQWKLLIALARFAGLRMPSEPLALTWADVDFDTSKMKITARKTRRYAGKGTRVVPIFPELRPYLQSVFETDAALGHKHVITRYRDTNGNLRTQFLRIIRRAGIEPWPRLFQNLRSSCETDLVERFPAHVACAWIGNSEAVARDHYLQVTDQHFAAASGQGSAEATPTAGRAVDRLSR